MSLLTWVVDHETDVGIRGTDVSMGFICYISIVFIDLGQHFFLLILS